MKLLRSAMKAHLKSFPFCSVCPLNSIVYDGKSGSKTIP